MIYDAFREAELKGWDARAETYEQHTARATTQSIPDLLAAVRLYPGARLLDICCGPGYAAGAAAALGIDVTGIDFAPDMVRQARRRFPGRMFEEGDAEHLAAADQSFDAVVCNIGLFHVTDPEQAVREAYRILKPGGRYAFSQWCSSADSDLYRIMMAALRDNADLQSAEPAPDAFALSDRDVARAILADAGFVDLGLRETPNILRVPSGRFFDFFMKFGVRVPLILERQAEQAEQAKLAIRERVEREVGKFEMDGEIRIPMPSIIVSGQRPGRTG